MRSARLATRLRRQHSSDRSFPSWRSPLWCCKCRGPEASAIETRGQALSQERRRRQIACAIAGTALPSGVSWTLEELAVESGASRSALAGRFTHLIGYPPIQYLTRWRMQLAAKRLGDRGAKVAAVAQEVGYDSEFSD